MLSRRRALVGMGAAAVVGAGGWLELGDARRQRLLHRLGLAGSPSASVASSGTPLESGTLSSKHMPRPVGWTLSLPPHPTGVVYCLHGKGDDHRYAFDTIHFHDFVAAGGAELAVAAVDGGPDSYWHQRSDGSNAQAMFLEDFVPMIDGRLRLSNRAVLGWSMGGYGALLVAETVPRLFRAVAVASPALWTSPGASAPGAFDNADDFRAHDVFVGTARLSAMTVRVDCGRSDPFYRAARTFAARLTPPPQTSYGPGFHDAAFWTSVAPLQVATLRAALGSAA